jgi:L,D-peptidoglycan transpeptidase YkuD (ErfK/YbiS/YcfS/YnhG family)
VWYALGAVLLAGVAFGLLLAFSQKPPVIMLEQARTSLTYARQAEAERYAPQLVAEAEQEWKNAMSEWKYQNDRLFFRRDFGRTLELATRVTEKSLEAAQRSISVRENLQSDLYGEIKSDEEQIEEFERFYSRLPIDPTVRKTFTSGKLLFLQGKQAYNRRDFKKAEQDLRQARNLTQDAERKASRFLETYFRQFDEWQQWTRETIEQSRRQTVIVVDKFARECRVYRSGKAIRTYNIEMGPNWIGDKRHRGDKATPEGRYYITKKKKGRDTIYYKALLINYPNEEDRRRYNEDVKNGNLPAGKGIGGLIEIHGEGGKGTHWTEGCVALTNKEMDQIFDLVEVGTPVTIVGSLRNLSELQQERIHP